MVLNAMKMEWNGNGMEWNEIEWKLNGKEWNGMERNGN